MFNIKEEDQSPSTSSSSARLTSNWVPPSPGNFPTAPQPGEGADSKTFKNLTFATPTSFPSPSAQELQHMVTQLSFARMADLERNAMQQAEITRLRDELSFRRLEQEKVKRMVIPQLQLLLLRDQNHPPPVPVVDFKDTTELLKERLKVAEKQVADCLKKRNHDENRIAKLRDKLAVAQNHLIEKDNTLEQLRKQLDGNGNDAKKPFESPPDLLDDSNCSLQVVPLVSPVPAGTLVPFCSSGPQTRKRCSSQRKFLCDRCSANFYSSELFWKHMAKKHGGTSSKSKSTKRQRKRPGVAPAQESGRMDTGIDVEVGPSPADEEQVNKPGFGSALILSSKGQQAGEQRQDTWKKFPCKKCPQSFCYFPLWSKHMEKVHNSTMPQGQMGCTICGRIFSTKQQHQKHYKMNHSKGARAKAKGNGK